MLGFGSTEFGGTIVVDADVSAALLEGAGAAVGFDGCVDCPGAVSPAELEAVG